MNTPATLVLTRASIPFTALDETAELFDTIFVSGGRRGLDLELSPADLVAVTNASMAAIAADR